ncbi:MAG TPA: FGLLP motif-containing membrane protein [Candidatus Limnocylindria bacterium]|nr:FGLLP motif-containing membrane protein [Candidatus Limnocylindria bacterium]
MLHARTRVSLASGATMVALLAFAALAHPALADEPAPTPLPEAISGPNVETLLATASGLSLECTTFTGALGDQYSCNRQVVDGVYYIATFPVQDPLVLLLYVSGPLPWPEDHDQFMFDFTAPFCEFTSTEGVVSFIPAARETGSEGLIFDDRACHLFSDYMIERDNLAIQQLIAWAKVDPSTLATLPPTLPPTAIPTAPPPLATPTPSPLISPTPAPTNSPFPEPTLPSGDGGNGGSGIHPGSFVFSVPKPTEVASEPLIIAESLALAGLLVLLMPFPAQLFNSTLETHYKTVRRWFRLDTLQAAAGRFGGFWDSFIGVLLFVLLSAVIYGLLDPRLGIDAGGAATIVGLAIGIVITTILASAPSLIDALRNGGTWRIRALPATLFVGLICVVISRLTGFLPGYLYGVILGFVFARELSRAEQGRANGLAAVALLAMAMVAWLLLALIGPDPSGFVATILATALSTLLVAGLEAVVFGLLPFRFLPGEPLHATNRLFWAALLLIGAFCFFHILINPASGYLSSSAQTPLITIVAMFLAFGLLSLAFWAYFRNKPAEA